MVEKPLKSFDRPLLRVSLSDSILVTVIEVKTSLGALSKIFVGIGLD